MTQDQTQSKNNKKKNAPTPVYKPYLRGNMVSRLAARRGLKILGLSHCSGAQAESCIHGLGGVHSCHMAVGDCVWFEEQ